MHPRLINQLLSNPSFLVDQESLASVIRDLINMNWWNTCGYLLGYESGSRKYVETQPREGLAIALSLFEWYYIRNERLRDEAAFRAEIRAYLAGRSSSLKQLKLHSAPYRRNYSQYYWENGKPTWITCTSRAKYAWIIVAQNGYIDFDGKCRLDDGYVLEEYRENGWTHDLGARFETGPSEVKREIRSQREHQLTVSEWVDRLSIEVMPERQWLFDLIKEVRTDPFKKYEAKRFAEGTARGHNELMYVESSKSTRKVEGLEASRASTASAASSASSASDASRASNASHASSASSASRKSSASDESSANRASHASQTSNASSASNASYASHASNASNAQNSSAPNWSGKPGLAWRDSPFAFGDIPGLDYPPYFKANVFGIAGHWKINEKLVRECKAWFDPFMGHGESPLRAARERKRYHGIELNPEGMDAYIEPIILDEIRKTLPDSRIVVERGDSREYRAGLDGQFDLCYTSPPYFDFEEYGGTNPGLQCDSWEDFHRNLTKPVFENVHRYLEPGGALALQVGTSQKDAKLWREAIESCGFRLTGAAEEGGRNPHAVFLRSYQNVLLFERIER